MPGDLDEAAAREQPPVAGKRQPRADPQSREPVLLRCRLGHGNQRPRDTLPPRLRVDGQAAEL